MAFTVPAAVWAVKESGSSAILRGHASASRAARQAAHRFLDLVTAAFVTVLIVSNVASSAKIVDWGVSLFGVRLAFDAGTLLFPVSYVFGDVLTEVYGYRRSRRVIWTGFACLAVSSLVLWIVRILPGEAGWEAGVGQAAYVGVLGGMSSGGIVLASLVAYLVGEFSNSVVLARLKVATRGRWLWMRTIGSTLVGEGLDTVIFVAIASAARVFPWSAFASLVLTNYLFKVAVEAAMTPVTYRMAAGLKRVEGVDAYDTGTNFNPFVLRNRHPELLRDRRAIHVPVAPGPHGLPAAEEDELRGLVGHAVRRSDPVREVPLLAHVHLVDRQARLERPHFTGRVGGHGAGGGVLEDQAVGGQGALDQRDDARDGHRAKGSGLPAGGQAHVDQPPPPTA